MLRRWWLLLPLLLLYPAPGEADLKQVGAHIASQTTTTIVSAVAGQKVQLQSGTLCVDSNGAETGITIQDGANTNLVGTSVVWVIGPGQCLWFPLQSGGYFNPTASGQSFQIKTTVGNGPVEVWLQLLQQ